MKINYYNILFFYSENSIFNSVYEIHKNRYQQQLDKRIDTVTNKHKKHNDFIMKKCQEKFEYELKLVQDQNETLRVSTKGVCFICQEDLSLNVSVLPCGHLLCTQCLEALVKCAKSDDFKCPMCRNSAEVKDCFKVYFN